MAPCEKYCDNCIRRNKPVTPEWYSRFVIQAKLLRLIFALPILNEDQDQTDRLRIYLSEQFTLVRANESFSLSRLAIKNRSHGSLDSEIRAPPRKRSRAWKHAWNNLHQPHKKQEEVTERVLRGLDMLHAEQVNRFDAENPYGE